MEYLNIINAIAGNFSWKNSQWLIIGKGPSFSQYYNVLSDLFCVVTLNDAIREVKHSNIAHFLDLEAFFRCEKYVERADKVVLPWYPHIRNKPSNQSLEDLVKQHASLKKLNDEGRLFWYDLISARKRKADGPVVSAIYFSSEAVLHFLALAGVTKIRTIGIDGGKKYNDKYKDLVNVSLLSNNQKNFNKQFQSFANLITKYELNFGPMDMELPIKIFVAATQSEYLPVKVLEYSIKKQASATTQVQALYQLDIGIPVPKNVKNRAKTPFSFQRFIIPEACDYKGRAIYLDSDMLVFKDIADLWRRDFGNNNVLSAYSDDRSGRIPQFSVMLMDCTELEWDIRDIVAKLDDGELSYENLMHNLEIAIPKASIEPVWNSLEKYNPTETALLHYTDMQTQPWVSFANPLAHLWVSSLRNAIDSGFIPFSLVQDEVKKGHIRPSLIYQLENKIDDPILLPKEAKDLDREFKAPYTTIQNFGWSRRKRTWFKIKANIRQILHLPIFVRIFHALTG